MSAPQHISRRGLFRAGARGIAVVVLAGGGALLALRNRSRAECPPRSTCDACGLREGCELEPRRAEREDLRR